MARMPSNKNNKWKILYATSLAWQLGFLILVFLGGFILLGIWLDKTFQTKQFFLSLGIVLGISLASYSTYRSYLPLVKKRNKNSSRKTPR